MTSATLLPQENPFETYPQQCALYNWHFANVCPIENLLNKHAAVSRHSTIIRFAKIYLLIFGELTTPFFKNSYSVFANLISTSRSQLSAT